MKMTRKAMILDCYMIIFLIALTTFVAVRYFDFSAPPFEDAAILMRYSQHLAEGHGIVWNVGQKPVDGATDFLFMVLLAAVTKMGLSLENGARLLGFSAHLVTVALVYLGIRHFAGSRLLASVSAIFLATGSGLAYVEAAFGTPVFAMFACLTWLLAFIIIEKGETHLTALSFALSALITGLIRPEGVFLVGFMLLSILYSKGWRTAQKTLIYFVAIFLLLGGTQRSCTRLGVANL